MGSFGLVQFPDPIMAAKHLDEGALSNGANACHDARWFEVVPKSKPSKKWYACVILRYCADVGC